MVVGASGVGFYGSGLDGAAPVDEDAPKGTGFLSDVCEVTEGAYRPAVAAGIRTVMLRLAPVLSSQGGMLGSYGRLLPAPTCHVTPRSIVFA